MGSVGSSVVSVALRKLKDVHFNIIILLQASASILLYSIWVAVDAY